MIQTDKKANESEIRIYQSLWKNIPLFVCCMAFAVGGYIVLIDPSFRWKMKVFGGLLSIIFFGFSGLFIIITTLYNRIWNIPCLIIHTDRLEIYRQNKGVYRTVNFADVRKFRFISDRTTKMIAIDYKEKSLEHQFEESSAFTQRLMLCNFNATGAIENILVQNLTMKGEDIYEILNERLKNRF